jgi:4-amino-4-deoxy-L-arabinose transferase-like glycosyltransferase
MSESVNRSDRTARITRLAPWLVIGGVLLFHAANNWRWLVVNVTSTGWDKPRHLARSLNYAQMLSPLTIRSLFGIMISDPVRPPLFPASAAPMYRLFGWSADVATMVNVVYMAIALAATYAIGRRWGGSGRGRRLGVVSVLLLAVLPMFYAMSRYFYLEFALTAMVALSVALLLATDGFQRKGLSLLFGLVLGLGLLTKRTFVIFAAGPVVVVILSAGLLPALWRRLKHRPRLYWKRALLALGGGLALAALWYVPNRETVHTLVLGDALFVIWWALAALAIYFATLPSAPLSNALSSFFLAAGLASTWYLARIEFLERVALYGYGVDDPRGRTLRLGSLDTYLYYVRKLGNEHLSIAIFALLLAVVVVAAVVAWRREGTVSRAVRRIKPEGWAVLSWVGGGYALLTLSIYQETRAFTPVLPAVALMFAAALLSLPWRRIRWGLLALVLGFGALQFLVLSYEPVQRLLPPQTFRLPAWGRTTSFAQGVYIQLPDEGRTDSGYWIVPDVLGRMEARRQTQGRDLLSLGMLVNTSQINAGPFNYLILTQYPELRVESLIERYDEASPYRRLFAHEYVAVKRINAGINPSQKAVIDEILDGPPPLFDQAFALETSYLLPDGDTVYLYRQRYPLAVDYPVEYVTDLAESLSGRTRAGDAILVTPPELLAPFVAAYSGTAEVYLAPGAEEEVAGIAAAHRRIFVVVGDAAAGEVQGLAQNWLNGHTFFASHEWAGSLQLLTYGTVAGVAADAPSTASGASLGEGIDLVGYDLPAGAWQPGDVVPLTLFWQRQAPIEADYQVFVHLIGADGQVVAQTDSGPGGGMQPTSGWQQGETVVDRHGLLLPEGVLPGQYELRLGMYRPDTGDRLPARDAGGRAVGDSLSLGQVEVTQRQAPASVLPEQEKEIARVRR